MAWGDWMADPSVDARLAALDGVPGTGSYEWRLADNRVAWSDGLLALFGLSSAPEGEDGFLARVHPEDRTRVEAETSSVLESGAAYALCYRIVRPDGQVRVIHDRGLVERARSGAAVLFRGVCFDTTDERPAQQAGPELSGAPRGACATDAPGVAASWSQEILKIIGRSHELDSAALAARLGRVHPGDRARIRTVLTEAMGRVGLFDLDYRVRMPDGALAGIRERGATIGPADPVTGRARRAVGIFIDPSRLKPSERALRSPGALLEALFRNAPVGLLAVDRSFRYVRVNEKLSEINGLPIEAHFGKRPDQLLPDLEGIDALYALWQEILDTGTPRMGVEITGKTPAGSRTRFWNVHFFPIAEEGEIVGIAGIAEDVTDRKRAEAEIRNNATQLQRILDGNVGFIGILDTEGTVLEANRTALEAAGLERSEVIGTRFWDAWWWSHDAAVVARLKDAIRQAATGTRVRYDEAVRLKDGAMITIDFLLSPVFDDAGRVTHLVPSGFDVTDRNRALDHVQMLMEEVNHRSKNMLALVQAIARQTVRSSPEEFLAKFSDRIAALARAQDLLVRGNWNSVDLRQLIRAQLQHFGDDMDSRIGLSGLAVTLTAQAAQSLSLVLHELATNAGKYGALSRAAGRVEIAWDVDRSGADPALSLSWTESGGPPVEPPASTGFGSTLMTTMIRSVFGTDAQMTYARDGFEWRLENGRGGIATENDA